MQFDSIGGSIMIQFYLIQCRLKLNIVSSQKENKNWILFIPLSLQIKILMDHGLLWSFSLYKIIKYLK